MELAAWAVVRAAKPREMITVENFILIEEFAVKICLVD